MVTERDGGNSGWVFRQTVGSQGDSSAGRLLKYRHTTTGVYSSWPACSDGEGSAQNPEVKAVARPMGRPDMRVTVLDSLGQIQYANAEVGTYFGCDPSLLCGSMIHRVLPSGIASEAESIVERVWRTGRSARYFYNYHGRLQQARMERSMGINKLNNEPCVIVTATESGPGVAISGHSPVSCDIFCSRLDGMGALGTLRPQELAVLERLGMGEDAAQIGLSLLCGEEAVRRAEETMLRRLHLDTRSELAALAVSLGLPLWCASVRDEESPTPS